MKKNFSFRRIEFFIVPLLAAAFACQVLVGIYSNSVTFDEPAYIAGGMGIWRNSDYRFNSEAVVIPQLLETMPAAFSSGVVFPGLAAYDIRESQWDIALRYIYGMGNNSGFIIISARLMVLLAGLAGGLAVYFWSRRLFGTAGALISLLFYSFSPTMLAHSGIAASDMVTALFFLLSLWAAWQMMKKVNLFSVLLCSFALSFLFLSKHSAFFFIPVYLLMACVRIFSANPLFLSLPGMRKIIEKRAARFSAILACAFVNALIIFLCIWAFYSFRYSMVNPADPVNGGKLSEFLWARELDKSAVSQTVDWAREKRILPEAYLYGFLYTYRHSGDRISFMNGFRSSGGRWYFFPYCFMVKTPLPFLILLFSAAVMLLFHFRKKPRGRTLFFLYSTAPLFIFIVIFMLFAVSGRMNIGHRHILPVYPPLFILAGAAGLFIRRSWHLCVILSAAMIYCSLSASPHFLSYFNLLAGGPENGYKHLADSSIDWGQDISFLREYLKKNVPSGKDVYFSRLGSVPPAQLGINAHILPSYFNPPHKALYRFRGGLYCVSSTMYQLVYYPALAAWNPSLDELYRRLSGELSEFLSLLDRPDDFRKRYTGKGELEKLMRLYFSYENLSFGKIILYLHSSGRKPDARAGWSILIFDMSDAEINAALSSPSAALD